MRRLDKAASPEVDLDAVQPVRDLFRLSRAMAIRPARVEGSRATLRRIEHAVSLEVEAGLR
jgi:hypothetical protein